ncbi:hypothetical protein F0562_004376 [Nyssa sinensis]|uniref:Uncharacterized protein n=1 Tax=Nyssa sinensis TaxID=561372 RepID=A0A5J5C221_9ASTE|nr:hypothetical protein F0562_004376 [Nyssa sinensis]
MEACFISSNSFTKTPKFVPSFRAKFLTLPKTNFSQCKYKKIGFPSSITCCNLGSSSSEDDNKPFVDADWRSIRARLVAGERASRPEEPSSEIDPDTAVDQPLHITIGEKWAHPIHEPEKGCLLIAEEKLDGFHIFERTVILLLSTGPVGPTGIILNRPSLMSIKETRSTVLDVEGTFSDRPLFFGGPLEESLFLVGPKGGDDWVGKSGVFEEVMNGLYYGTKESVGCAAEMVKRNVVGLGDFRFFDGYCGWKKEQLMDEVTAGYWTLAACSPSVIGLAHDVSVGLWEEILGLLGPRKIGISTYPLRPLRSMMIMQVSGNLFNSWWCFEKELVEIIRAYKFLKLITGMGTEIQSKTYFPGYYSVRDLNDNVGSGIWGLYHEDKTLKNSQYKESFLTRPAIDGYLGYPREQLRKTILKHESIFRHQLQELHHLYKRQRDLMNEIRRREVLKHPISAETSQSKPFLSSLEDANKTWNLSNFPFMDSIFGRPSTQATDSIQSPLSFMKGENMSNPFPSQERVILRDCETLESKCNNMFQKRMFNLEHSAGLYLNNEGKTLEERVSGVLGVESYPLNRNCEFIHGRNVNLSLGSALNSGCNCDASRCNLYLRKTCDMADLNEPIQFEETSVSASVDNLCNIICLKEDIRRKDVSVNSNSGTSGFHLLSNTSSQSSLVGRDRGICLNSSHSENKRDQKEQFTGNFEAGKTRCHSNSLHRVVSPKDSPTPFKSLQVEPRKVHEPLTFLPSDQSKTQTQGKRKIFGVEISEGRHDQSVVAPHICSLWPLFPQSDVANSDSSWRKPSNSLIQNVISVRENPWGSSSDPANKSSNGFMQSPEFVGGQMHANSCLRSISSSTAEISYQTGPCSGSQLDTKQLQVCCSSIGFDFQSGTTGNISEAEQFVPHGPMKYDRASDCMDVKPAKDTNTDLVPPSRFHDEVIPQQNPGFLDGQRMHDNPKGGLPWLKAKAFSSGKLTKERESSYKMNLDSSKNYFHQFAHKAVMEKGPSLSLIRESTSSTCVCDFELKKIKVDECPCNRKILGFSILNVPHSPKDLTSQSSPSKSGGLASNVDADNTRKNLAHDPKSGDQLEVKDLVTEKGLGSCISGLRHHIDLNLCLNEEEAPTAPSLPRAIVKIATTEIDLEAPAVLESEMDLSPESDSPEDQPKKPTKLSLDESRESHEELVRVAAEAIIAISSSGVHNLADDPTHYPSEASSSDSLHWFAEIISSYKGDLGCKVRAVSTGTNDACHEESIPDGIDYFEFMTLKLIEIKIEECYCRLPALEKQKDEEIGATLLPKRPRKGQARRRRQQKDFQRDILPGLVSLLRHEVTEDLQTIEELFRASGCTWQSSLSQRDISKNGKGRRRLGGSTPSLAVPAVCPPLVQQPIYKELGLEHSSLTGWGKRTRRLPRQKCPTGNPTLALKC